MHDSDISIYDIDIDIGYFAKSILVVLTYQIGFSVNNSNVKSEVFYET